MPTPGKILLTAAALVRRAAEANLDVLGGIIEWISRSKPTWSLDQQVHVELRRGQTFVRVDHRIPPDEHIEAGWRVTTHKQLLPSVHFPSGARATINGASDERGRRLYCIDQASDEVIAAMSYHVDEDARMPVLLTAIGLRVDAGALPDLYDRTRGAVLLLKQYVHEIARQLGRGAHVDIDIGDPEVIKDLEFLGFKRAPRVRGLRPSGTHLRQQPLD